MRAEEFFWFAPFACLGLMAFGCLRPPPGYPAPLQSRVVTDARGTDVAVPLPFAALVRYGGSDYLELTHAPDALRQAGEPKDRDRFASGLMSRIYPRILRDDELWKYPTDLESLLARDRGGTYFDWNAQELRRIGIAALVVGWNPEDRDHMIFTATRIENAALGTAERGEGFIADYRRAYADLERELQPATLTHRPRAVGVVSSKTDWTWVVAFGDKDTHTDDRRMGMETATDGYMNTGRLQDAERILAMNPDIVFVRVESVADFLQDPRWRGLKAVQDRRVYEGLNRLRGSLELSYGLDLRPLWARWGAEIAHPERLQPRLRELLRAHFESTYGYRLSDTQIDNLLRIDENKNTVGYARFEGRASPLSDHEMDDMLRLDANASAVGYRRFARHVQVGDGVGDFR
jgi:hypothetical protein